MTLKIESGRYYRTRDGRKVGPMMMWRDTDAKPWSDHETDGTSIWSDGGKAASWMPELDLIAEWTDAPDLTAITTPFGLLDEVYGPGTQQALRDSGGPWEWFHGFDWIGFTEWVNVSNITTVRLAHAPHPVARDMWLHKSGKIAEWIGIPNPADSGWTPVRVTFAPGDPASYRVEVRE